MYDNKITDFLKENYKISEDVIKMAETAENDLKEMFAEADRITEYNQYKVLNAMQKNKLSDVHFAGTTGYGYNDLGRDVLEQIYADIFHAEAGLVRPQVISGTHALTVALAGNLRPGDEIFSPVGLPYDTLQGVIGIRPEKGSLAEYGITYSQRELLPDGNFDFGLRHKVLLLSEFALYLRVGFTCPLRAPETSASGGLRAWAAFLPCCTPSTAPRSDGADPDQATRA